jgi:ArsR family transcriptional regulator
MRNRVTKRKIDVELYERQVRICKAFANPTRLRLLDLIARRDYLAADLHKQLSISKANLSQHIAILKAAGVVVTRREGKRIRCHLALPEVKKACMLIRNVLRAQIRNGNHLSV